MTMVFLGIALLALSYVLSRATDVLVFGIKQLGRGTAFEAYGLTTFLVALATSLPELFVGIASALENEPILPLGVVVGSNLSNVSLVIGGAALISGTVMAQNKVLKRDIFMSFAVSTLPLLMLIDRRLGRVDGLVLLIIYVVFVISTMNQKKRSQLKQVGDNYYEDLDLSHKILRVLGKKDVEQGVLRLAVGSAALVVCADLIVRLAEMISVELGIPVILVGLFMVSIGTTLPELTFGIKTVKKREYLMAFGNLVGSTIANSSLILGLVALIRPIVLNGDSQPYFLSVIGFVLIFGLFWALVYSKKRLERWEGAVLVAAYFGFIVVQMLFQRL